MIGSTIPLQNTIAVTPRIVPVQTMAPAPMKTKTSFWDTFSSATNSLTNLAAGVTNTVQTLKNNSGVAYNPGIPANQMQNSTQAQSNSKKYLVIGGIAIAALGVAYVVFKKKKKS